MNWTIFAIGKPRLGFAKQGIEEYLGRMRPFASVKVEYLKASQREAESALLLARSEGMLRVVMDERGEMPTSRAFYERVLGLELSGVKQVALLIGGANGHTEALRKSADLTLALSRFTLQHELALVVLAEQIYRAYTLKAGLPYHRD